MASSLKLILFLHKNRVADPSFRINWTSTESTLTAVVIYAGGRSKRLFYKRINQNDKAGFFEVPFSYASLPSDYEIYSEQGDISTRIFLTQRGDLDLRTVKHKFVENVTTRDSRSLESSTFWWILIPVLIFLLLGFIVYTSLHHRITNSGFITSKVPILPAM